MKGEILKQLRKEKNITQAQLSTALNVTRSLIAMVESGKQEGGREFSKKVADYFNVSLDYLEGLEENTNKRETMVSNFLKYLVDTGIIEDENNIDKETEEMILNVVKKEIAKIKKGE